MVSLFYTVAVITAMAFLGVVYYSIHALREKPPQKKAELASEIAKYAQEYQQMKAKVAELNLKVDVLLKAHGSF